MEEKTLNPKEAKLIEHLAFLSVKHSVYLSELYQALVSARRIGQSICGGLLVKYRGIVNRQAIFLLTKGTSVVGQFRVTEEFLLRKNISFESWLDTDKIRKQVAKENSVNDSTLIRDLRHGMKNVNVNAVVLEIQKPQLLHTQYGTIVSLTNVWIADETGKVKLCVWGERGSSLAVDNVVQIKAASVRVFRGERRLIVGRSGTFSMMQNSHAILETQPTTIAQNIVYA